MPEVYDDIMLTVETEKTVPFGVSYSQNLNNGIVFTIRSQYARMIQFKCRRLIWTEGPEKDKELIIDFKNTAERLDYKVDSLTTPDPFYDSGGACQRSGGKTIIADQPDVSYQKGLYFEQGKDLEQMASYGIINEFRALSFIISNNKVIRTVQWFRTGKNGETKYHDVVVTEVFRTIPPGFLNILRAEGYNVPQLYR